MGGSIPMSQADPISMKDVIGPTQRRGNNGCPQCGSTCVCGGLPRQILVNDCDPWTRMILADTDRHAFTMKAAATTVHFVHHL